MLFLTKTTTFKLNIKKNFSVLEESILIGDSIENLYIPIFNEDLTNLELLRKRGVVLLIWFNKKLKNIRFLVLKIFHIV